MGLRIAFIGTRGVPARYGGFETCAEEIGRRLVRRGHEVRVYCRKGYYPKRLRSYEGMSLVYLPSFHTRSLETLSHTAFSLLHAGLSRIDVALVFNTANSPSLRLARIFGKRVVLHTDGLEWERDKWSGFGRRYFRWAARHATRLPIPLISDSRAIQDYYRRVFHRETTYVSYGAALVRSRDPSLLAPFGVEPGGYFLQMARFEPENNIHLTVEAFAGLETDKKLVLVGGTAFKSPYIERLKAMPDPRVVFAGFVYEPFVVGELLANAYVYIHGNEAGGTNPGLLQAMGAGCAILSRDVVFNREAGGGAVRYYAETALDLREKMRWALEHPEALPVMREEARRIVRDRYDWDAAADDYEALLIGAAG